MSDLSEQLRYASYSLPSNGQWIERNGEGFPNNVCSQAADEMDQCDAQKAALVTEVERLTAERDEARQAEAIAVAKAAAID